MSEYEKTKQRNKINFNLPVNYNLVTNRRYVEYRSVGTTYSHGNQIEFKVKSNFDYIYNKTSFIKLKFTPSDTINFGSCDALNLFDELTIIDGNGLVLDNIKKKHIENRLKKYFQNSNDELKLKYNNKGYYPPTDLTDDPKSIFTNNTDYYSIYDVTDPTIFILPLDILFNILRPLNDTLYPDVFYNDLTIRILLNNSANSYITAGGVVSYTIQDVSLFLDSYTLSKKLYDALLDETIEKGFDLPYITYDIERFNMANITNVENHFMYTKNLNHALSCCGAFFESASENNVNFDSNEPCSIVSSYQFRISSNYYPNQTVNDIELMYHYALQFYKKRGSVSLDIYRPRNLAAPTGPTAPYSRGEGILVADFSRSCNKNDKTSTRQISQDTPLDLFVTLNLPTNTEPKDFYFYLIIYHIKTVKLYSNEKSIISY